MRSRGLTENTLMILTSDQGEGFLDHGRIGHGNSMYQELLHVPLIMSGPGIEEGVVDSTRVGLYDLFPTILTAVGEPVPDIVEGMDILSGNVPADRSIPSSSTPNSPDLVIYPVAMQTIHSAAIVSGDRKTIGNMIDYEYISFDLAEDPIEMDTIISDSMQILLFERYWTTPVLGRTMAIRHDSTGAAFDILRDLGYIN